MLFSLCVHYTDLLYHSCQDNITMLLHNALFHAHMNDMFLVEYVVFLSTNIDFRYSFKITSPADSNEDLKSPVFLKSTKTL